MSLSSDSINSVKTINLRPKLIARIKLFFGLELVFIINLLVYIFLLLVKSDYLQYVWEHQRFWKAFNEAVLDILCGSLISFLFYFLLVELPRKKVMRRLKLNFSSYYEYFKKNLLKLIIKFSIWGGRSDIDFTEDTLKNLLTHKGFNEFMKGGESNEGIYAFWNYVGAHHEAYQEIMNELHKLQKEIEFILLRYDFTDDEIFERFKNLNEQLLSRNLLNYDETSVKLLTWFIHEKFGNFSVVNGFYKTSKLNCDIVQEMILNM